MRAKPDRGRGPSRQLLLIAVLTTIAACSNQAGKVRQVAANCYAKAVPTVGEGGLAWGPTAGVASKKSLSNCVRYAARSGGTPQTCKVTLARCKSR